jgi:hypothetical protein
VLKGFESRTEVFWKMEKFCYEQQLQSVPRGSSLPFLMANPADEQMMEFWAFLASIIT